MQNCFNKTDKDLIYAVYILFLAYFNVLFTYLIVLVINLWKPTKDICLRLMFPSANSND